MNWSLNYTDEAFKNLEKLDKKIKKRILEFLQKRLNGNPRLLGEPLTGNFKGLWRYRVGDYRLICEIKDNQLIIVLIRIGHRKEIYKQK